MKYDDLDAMFNQDTEQLYLDLGQEVAELGLGMESPPNQSLIQRGREWMSQNRARLAELLCHTQVIALYRQSNRVQDRVIVAAAVIDLISSLITGVGAATVSVLLLREGVNTLCSSHPIHNNGVEE